MDCVMLANSIGDAFATAGYIFLVIIGFTAVIFVHELGHFLAAKKVGIRVERFAIGFGPRLLGFKKGETDYCLNLLPLGGYVKMTGQEDFQLEKDAVPDPRAFNNKPVGARAVVIGAGVVMNVIFAAILFMIVFMVGKEFQSNQAGDVEFGAGGSGVILPGDVILEMDGQKVEDYIDVMLIAALYDKKEKMPVRVRRGDKELMLGVELKPAKGGPLAGLNTLGVDPESILTVPALNGSADDYKDSFLSGQIQGDDRIIQAQNARDEYVPVKYGSDLVRLAQERGGRPLPIKVQRQVAGRTVEVDVVVKCVLENVPTKDFQLMGAHSRLKVAAVSRKMPAYGVLNKNDVVIRIDEFDYPLFQQFTDAIQNAKGRPVKLVVERDGQRKTVQITPDTRWYRKEALVGIAPGIEDEFATLGQVSDNSEFGRAGLPSGAVILAVTQPEEASPAGAKPQATSQRAGPSSAPEATISHSYSFLGPDGWRAATATSQSATQPTSQPQAKPLTWSQFYRALLAASQSKNRKVTVVYRLDGRVETVVVEVPPPGDWQRGIAFRPMPLPLKPLTKLYKASDPLTAAGMGARKTGQFIVQVYVTLDRLLFSNTVGVKHLSGPVGIAVGSYRTARSGIIDLLYFLAMISANLAVINFLPLPIVDGGLMAFLVYEKIRRKPVSVRVMQWTQIVGFVLIIGLFLWVTWQDILRLLLGG